KLDFEGLGEALLRRYDHTLELFFFRCGYGGVARIGSTRLTVCLVVQREVARSWDLRAASMLEGLAAEVPPLRQPSAPPPTPGGPLALPALPFGPLGGPTAPGAPPLFPLGDQFAVLPSLTGTGIGFALTTGRMAAEAWATLGPRAALAYNQAARRAARR